MIGPAELEDIRLDLEAEEVEQRRAVAAAEAVQVRKGSEPRPSPDAKPIFAPQATP